MTTHSEIRIVPYTADLMFAVVADVEKYPQFLPWVTGLSVLSREQVKGREVIRAEMAVGFARFSERYISRVILDAQARAIDVAQTEGPFRILENHWRFTPQDAGCRIDFSITYEFKNFLLNAVAGSAFDRVTRRMSAAFEARAKALSKQVLERVVNPAKLVIPDNER